MIVLAIDTATPQVGVAVGGVDGPMASVAMIEGRRHGEVLAPALTTVCGLAGITLGDVGLVAVDVGPGLFTGLRVGLATAAALAHALDRPAVGIMSTDVLAAAHGGAGHPVAAVVDIRRGEVAWSLHRGGVEERSPVVASPGEAAQELARTAPGALAVGDGALRYAGDFGRAGIAVGPPSAAHPSPVVLAELGAARAGEAGPGADLSPRYLRDADVRIGWDRAPRG